MQIAQALRMGHERLSGDTAALDAELLLASVLGKDRSYLRTWPEQTLTSEQANIFESYIAARKNGVPVAHLLGTQGFWALELEVNTHTLIPRPDTETLVEQALNLTLQDDAKVLDLGTGTGAIALALASEQPHWRLVAVDCVAEAVALARRNTERLALANVEILQSHWFEQVPDIGFDMIVSNPPYIDEQDPHLAEGDVRFEPSSALVAAHQGLADLAHIIEHAPAYLLPQGWLLLEHGYDQGAAVFELLEQAGYQEVKTVRDLAGNDRVSMGRRAGD